MFGLDLKSVIITAIFIIFVLPWLRSMMLSASSRQKTQTTQ